MKPVWIKLWGLVPITRKGYLITLSIGALLVLVVAAVCAFLGRLPPVRSLWEEIPVRGRPDWWEYWYYNNLYRILSVILLAQLVETVLTLRRFSKLEAEQKRRGLEQPAPDPTQTPTPAQ